MKEQYLLFLIIVTGIILGLLSYQWNAYQFCRMEECVEETKWLCTKTNNLEQIHWIAISILMLLGIWKIKDIVY